MADQNLRDFDKQLDAFIVKVSKRINFLADFTKDKVLADLQVFSPIKTGRFISSWEEVDASEAVQAAGPGLKHKAGVFPTIVIVNDTPYGLEVIPEGFRDPETGQDQSGEIGLNAGRSNQAPAGIIEPFLSKFVAEWEGTVAAAVRANP